MGSSFGVIFHTGRFPRVKGWLFQSIFVMAAAGIGQFRFAKQDAQPSTFYLHSIPGGTMGKPFCLQALRFAGQPRFTVKPLGLALFCQPFRCQGILVEQEGGIFLCVF